MILAIDDSSVGLAARRVILEHAGYEVLASTDLAEGLQLFRNHPIGLVLMDYYLAGTTGDAVRREMKRLRSTVPIVVLSGATELPQDMSNIDLFLSKLDGPEALLKSVAETLGAHEARQAA